MIVENMEIVSHERLATNVYELILKGQKIVDSAEVGQFLHLKVSEGSEPLLRRPISIAEICKQKDQLTVIYRAGGAGTKLLSQQREGKINVLGPLGHGFPLEEATEGDVAIVVGGGIGVPPLYELTKRLTDQGVKVIAVLGFASKTDVFYESKFNELATTFITTMDGTYGEHGTVIDVMKEKQLSFDVFYACGPTPMLKAIESNFSDYRGYLSLEERMGCGIGACFACVCHTKNDPTKTAYKKICTDGPVFKMGEVEL